MDHAVGVPPDSLHRFRAYLRLLAELHVGRRVQAGFEASDVVQQTLLDAVKDHDRFRGRSDTEVAA